MALDLIGRVSLRLHIPKARMWRGNGNRSESPFGRTGTSPWQPKLGSDGGDTKFIM